MVSVERDAQHFRFISQIVDTLKAPNCYLLRTDVFRYLDRCNWNSLTLSLQILRMP